MHVESHSKLNSQDLTHKLLTLSEPAADQTSQVTLDQTREPQKFFLKRIPWLPPAAAEIAGLETAPEGTKEGTNLTLRLMWGPLPAPFPRAVAAVGIALAALMLWLFNPSTAVIAVAAVIGIMPLIALALQKQGETRLQQEIHKLIDGTPFVAKAH